MTTTKKYLVKFTPVKKFYFGADTVFNLTDDKTQQGVKKAGKPVISLNPIISPTTNHPVGRYLLLQQNGLLGKYNVEA